MLLIPSATGDLRIAPPQNISNNGSPEEDDWVTGTPARLPVPGPSLLEHPCTRVWVEAVKAYNSRHSGSCLQWCREKKRLEFHYWASCTINYWHMDWMRRKYWISETGDRKVLWLRHRWLRTECGEAEDASGCLAVSKTLMVWVHNGQVALCNDRCSFECDLLQISVLRIWFNKAWNLKECVPLLFYLFKPNVSIFLSLKSSGYAPH